ncbi:hypothetical protein GCM10022198_12020 [Klugiella xanthotipulae]|uniref:Uncharacterized protein n=1 Tax=Klugiella xanthotipulae TaxID=244735 RepID=A0A543I4N4_9MICO|nr:hypothetical protein FB466_0363 [Klugiella xanthotipulae]
MSRVLSTEQAQTAIRQIQSIMSGGFTDQISQDIFSAGGA